MTILLPFDGSPAALRAVELLAGHAGNPGAAALTVLNVQARPLSAWPGAALDPALIERALLDAGRTAVKPAVTRLAAAGFTVDAAVRMGAAAQVILQEAHARGAQLVVMGTRGEGALQGFALGSVALRVAHGEGPPVILVKPEDRLPATLGARLRVLLAIDGSAQAMRAAERLAGARVWLGALDVHLVHVQRPFTVLEAVLPPHDDVAGQWSTREGEEATAAARALLQRDNIAHHLHLTVGDPAREVMVLAEQTKADLVVLGTRGLGAAHHALIGSVALKAAALARVPVMLVS